MAEFRYQSNISFIAYINILFLTLKLLWQNISVDKAQDSFLWSGTVPSIMVKVFEKKILVAKQSELC
jgi:hypothetical protein